ncbi:MAG: hypothetical protein CMK09_18680 [Ponticaulis sp.]|nr:hypothetical protein [Ponticaulis sp.]|tara:strand:+ start:108571 stop:109305 length:735 start_codon:yes stop_codon:yes gene_type:complete
MQQNMLEGLFWDLVDDDEDYQQVEKALLDMCSPFGVTVISCVEIRAAAHNSNPFIGRLIGKRDGEWLRRYRREELFKHDVALQHVPRTESGFSWQHVEDMATTKEQRNVFDVAREHWVGDGFLIPNFGADGRIGFTGFYGSEICDDPVTRRLFEFAGNTFYKYAYRKAQEQAVKTQPLIDLTKRQLEVLYWISKGKTDTEMAEILEISPATVNRHVELAKEKIGVRSRTEAVHYALVNDLISRI